MKSVVVPFLKGLYLPDAPTLTIEKYMWMENGYAPKVEVYLCHDGDRMLVSFKVFEDVVVARERRDNGKIWCDSCVEMFLRPFDDDDRYINFEFNPYGAAVMSIGAGREDRQALVFGYKDRLKVVPRHFDGGWSLAFEVPFGMLSEIYQREEKIGRGARISANFYKCGDETPYPHFGMWREVESDVPNFHLPEFFGELILG